MPTLKDKLLQMFSKSEIIAIAGLTLTVIGFGLNTYFQHQASTLAQETIEQQKIALERQHLNSQLQLHNISRLLEQKRSEFIKLTQFIEQYGRQGVIPESPQTLEPTATIDSTNPAISVIRESGPEVQFLLDGTFGPPPAERRWWLGTLSGTVLWPQVEVPEEPSGSTTERYRIIAPRGVQNGELVLIDAGPEAAKQFRQQRSDPLNDFGLLLRDVPDVKLTRLQVF
jgi:hypothetical protein